MARGRRPLGQFIFENASRSKEEVDELVRKTFPDANLSPKLLAQYLSRARKALREQEPVKKKPGPKPGFKAKAKPTKPGSRLPEASVPDLLETPDAKQLTALIMRVGLNTAEQVMARLKHIEAKQR